jgi:hypothetical protein
MRYRRPDWDWPEIKRDVVAAIAAGRISKHAAGISFKPHGSGRLARTECGRRVYVITKARSKRPEDNYSAVWIVVTSLVPDHVKEAA